ncbi:MAG: hypothetical protein ACJAT2_002006 [Bacteriovoracaceae bacterium]|jgi:hypothetical protein
MNKVSALSHLIYEELLDGSLDSALDKISNRERLLNIVFRTNDSILLKTDINIQTLSKWKSYTYKWAQKEEEINRLIEEKLLEHKKNTTNEIAAMFNNKSRHKGYDLSSLK